MSRESRRLAGVLLILVPAVVFGGVSILRLLIDDPAYQENPLRQDLWRAGHAHAGVLLILALVSLQYVDDARLGPRAMQVARHGIPLAAILLPAAMFLSVLDADATEPNALIHLAWIGALSLAGGVLTLGIGLLRNTGEDPPSEERRDEDGWETAQIRAGARPTGGVERHDQTGWPPAHVA